MKRMIFCVSLMLMLVFINALPAQKRSGGGRDEKLPDKEVILKSDKSSTSKSDKDTSILKEIFNAVTKDDDKPVVREKESNSPAPRKETDRRESSNYERPVRNEPPVYQKPSPPKPDRNDRPVQKEDPPAYNYPDRNTKPNRTDQTYKEEYFNPVPHDYYRNSTRNKEKPVVTDRDTPNRSPQDYTYKPRTGQRAQSTPSKPASDHVTRSDQETRRNRTEVTEVLPDRKTEAKPSRSEYKLITFSGEPESGSFSVTNDLPPSGSKPQRPVERYRTPVSPPPPYDPDGDGNGHHPGHGGGGNNHGWNHGDGHHNHHNWSYDYHNYSHSWWDWDYWRHHRPYSHSYWSFGISFFNDWDYWYPYYYGAYYYPVYGWSGWYPYSYYTWYNPSLHTWRTWHYSYIRPTFYYSLTYRDEIVSFTGYLVNSGRTYGTHGTSGLQGGNGRDNDYSDQYSDSHYPRRGYGVLVKLPGGEKAYYRLDNYGNRLARKLIARYGRQNRKLMVEVRGVYDEDTDTIITYSLKRIKWYKNPTVALHFYYGPLWHRPFRWF